MKRLITLTIFLSSVIAHASYYQSYCSDAFSNVKIADGHSANSIKIKEKIENSPKERYRDYKRGELTKEIIKDTDIEKISDINCTPGASAGFTTWKNTKVSKILLKNANGSKFPKETVGVSKDGISIETTVICVLEGSSRSSCNE
jgi:hypothetical protein